MRWPLDRPNSSPVRGQNNAPAPTLVAARARSDGAVRAVAAPEGRPPRPRRGERRLAGSPPGDRLSLAADEPLAPAAELVGLFGLPRGALGPIGAHRAAEVRVARSLAGRTIALGCGEVGQSLVVDAEVLVACLDRAVLF